MSRVKCAAKGFTIVELTLAMAFISVLLLAIATTVMQIGGLYNRGMLLREANQTARVLADDLRRTLNGVSAFSIEAAEGRYYAFDNVGGRMCTGQYSYIWNTGAALQAGTDSRLTRYAKATPADPTPPPVRLVKVPDGMQKYCQFNSATGGFVYPDIVTADRSKAQELIAAGDHTLALHSFRVRQVAYDSLTHQRLYIMRLVIGTDNQKALKPDATGEKVSCYEPGATGTDVEPDPMYCAVREFNFAVRTGS